MKFCKKTLSFILAFVLLFSSITPVSAKNDAASKKTTIKGQEVIIGDTVYYVFSTDKNAKSDLIEAHEKGELQLEKLQGADGLEISGGLNGASVGAGQTEEAISYTLNIKGTNFIGVGGKTFDWNTLPDGLEVQVLYIDEDGYDHNIGSPITINGSNYNDMTTRTFEIVGDPIAFGLKTNVDSETYLTDVLLTNENAPDPSETNVSMTFDLVQVPSTNLSVKWVDVNQQPLARENTPSTILKNILTFNFIENRTFDLPNQDKEDPYFRLINKIKRVEVKDMEGATALVDSKKDGEEVTLDGKIYKLTTSYSPAFNQGSKIQLMYMPDVIDRTKNPESPTPDKYVRVTIDAGEGTKLAQGQTKKVYDVRIGKVLKAEHYPKLELLEGHKDPITWTIAPETAITKAENIKGNAAKTAAETITAANLKAVDTTALQGQELTEAFWHKGVALADNTPADKKDAFAALLKEATVTDKSSRTTDTAGDFVGTLLVTFKDGSTLQVPNQKLIVKPNTVTVALDKAAGKEHPLRDGDTTVKGTITADSNTSKFPVSVDGAVVTIKKGNTVLTRTLANADGSFVAGVKDPLHAGEDISVVVTLPESKTESAPVTEKVQLNPDKLNEIIPTGQEVVKNLKGKKGVDQAKVTKLEEAITKAFTLVDKGTSAEDQMKKLPKATVTVDATGQKSLDDQYEAIKKAIEELTGNSAPKVTGTSHKEIFKGDKLNLEEGITVTDADSTEQVSDIAQVNNKDFTYTVEKVDAKGNKTPVTDTATINQTAGTYEVTYTAKDKSGAEGRFVMTLVVKEPVIKLEDKFPEVIPEGYVKVEFKSGEHAGLKGTSKFLVREGGAKSLITEPEIVPEEGWKVNDPKWTVAIPDTFATNFETTANMLEKVKTTEPTTPEEKAKYVTVEFKADDAAHAADPRGTFENVGQLVQTTKFWVLKGEQVTFNVPTVTEKENYKFTGWDNEVKASYDADAIHTATYKKKVVTEDPKDATNYAKLTFKEGDHGKFAQNAKTEIWVLKNEEVKFNAPTPTADKDFTFAKWDPELQTKYDADKTHTAKYTSDKNVSDTPVEGFQEVKFTTDSNGKFENDKTEKSVWVRPDTLVDLTDKAPKVTVTNDKKAFTGWSQKLIAEFAKAETATEIKAVYKDKVLTEEPTDKTGYAEVKFDAGKHGTFEKQDEKTTFWVLKGQQVTADFKAPSIKANDGYTFKAWDPEVKTSYDKDQTHTATYTTNKSISDTKVEGFQEVKFLPGTDGTLENNAASKSVWVEPGVTVDLRAKAPKVIANEGKVHTGWDRDLVGTFKLETENGQPKATEITAKYKDKVVTKDPKDKNYVTVEFLAGAHGKFEQVGDPKKDQTTKFWVYKNEKVTFNAPTVTADEGYSFTVWKEPIKTVYSENTTHTAQYSNTISDKYVEGWTEITFNSGDHGRFVADAKTVKWVDPKADIKLSDMAPGITPDTNYSFKAWTKPGEGANAQAEEVALDKVAKYDKATTFTATYESDISDEAKEGFVKVIFAPGENGKFINEDGTAITGEVSTHVRKDVTVDLRDKAPKVMPNTGYGHTGWSQDLEKVNVKEETTITATYTKGEFDAKNITSFEILGPEKAAYADGDTLVLTGFTVVAIDKAGIRKEYTVQDKKLKNGDEELTGITLKVGETTIDLENLPKLTNKAHDNKPITLTKDKKDYNSTVHLSVSKTKTNQPTDLVAANQGENPTETKIKGKAQKGDTVKIYVPGNDKPIKEVVVTNEDGTFETSVSNENKPYDVGTKFNVTATAEGKEESSPQEVKVIKDVNGDWKDDGEDQKTPTPTAKALNVGKEPKVTTITGKTEPGAKVVAKVGETIVGTATAGQDGNYTIEATKTGKADGGALDKDTEVKVTAQVDKKLVSDPTATVVKIDKDGNGVDDEKEQFDIKKATKVEILQNPYKMNYSVKEKNGKTPFDAKGVIIRLTDASGKTATYNYDDITKEENKGKFTLSPADKEQIGLKSDGSVNAIPFTVTVTGADTKPSVTAKENITVILDKDGNGVDDRTENTPEPTVTARNIGTDGPDGKKVPATKTTVEIETEPNADVTIEYKDAQGKTQTITGKADGQGKLTKEITPKLDKDTPVKVTVKDGEKKPTDKTVKVFDDLDDNKIPDDQAGQTERPAAIAYNFKDEAKTTIKGEAEPGATVVAKVGKVEVGTATAGADGKYTIEATKDGAKLPKGTKVSVTAKLAPKGESPAQETVVYDDLDGDGQPDTSQAFDKDKIRDLEVVASPDKMVYNNKEHLNLTGMKVLLTDQMGNKKIVEFAKFEEYGITVSPLNDIELSDMNVADGGNNGQKIKAEVKVAVGNTQKTYSDETPTALKVNKDQSAQPTDVLAANQGKTPTETKIKGKAKKGDTINIYAPGQVPGKDKPIKTVSVANDDGTFETSVSTGDENNKQPYPVGTKFNVTATEVGKTESAPQEAKVFRDKDGDWKDDAGKVELEKPIVDPIKVGDPTVKVQTPGAGITKITVTDEKGKTIDVVKDGNDWKVDGKPVQKEGTKLIIPTKDKGLDFGANEKVEITNHDDEGNEGKTVVATKPANLKPMENPTIDPISTQSTKITGKSLPGSKVLVYLPGDTDETAREALVKSDGSYELTLATPLADKSLVKVKATNSQRDGVGKAETKVGLNLQELEKTDAEADKLINDSKTGNNFDPTNNKYDKNLEEKSKAAKEVLKDAKDKDDANDPTQTQVNTAEKELRDAINQKDADDKVKVVEKLVKDGQKPSEEDINKAQEAIDKVEDPTAKQELQDRLDKAKLIAELKDKVDNAPKDDKDHPEYKTKPSEVIKALEDAKKEAEKVIKDYKEGTKTAEKTPEEAKKALDDAIAEYNKEQVVVSFNQPSSGSKRLIIHSLQNYVTIEIYVAGQRKLETKTLLTSSVGALSVTLEEALKSGQEVKIIGKKINLQDGESTLDVK